MGRVLKIVYSHLVEHHGRIHHLSNAIPQILVDYIRDRTLHEDSFNLYEYVGRIEQSNPSWRGHFTLSNFYYYFKKHYGDEFVIGVDDIVENDDIVYAYPIEINATTINALCHSYSLTIDGQTSNYTVPETFGPKVLDLMRRGKLKIIISNIHDPCIHSGSVNEFEKLMKSLGVDESNLIFIFGNKFENHAKYYPGSKVKFTYGILPLQQQAVGVNSFPIKTSMGYISDIVRKDDLDNLRNTIRPKRFLCFNRSLRSHRYYLAYMFMKQGLLDQGIFSFVNDNDDQIKIRRDLEKFEGSKISDDDFQKLMSLLPIELDTQALTSDQKRGFTTDNNKKEWYTDSYIHLISETSFDIDDMYEPFFSEKTFRPIINLQPFIMIGNVYSLKRLHQLGFKTFSPYIDESYDNERDPKQRMQMIQKEILKLSQLSMQQLHDLYYRFEDILIDNFNTMMSYQNDNPFATAVSDIINYNYE